MSKDRENRYQDAAEMQKDLSRCLSEPVGDYVRVNKKQSKPHAVKRERKRSVSRAFVLALVLVILIGGIVAGILFVKDSIGGGAARQDAYMPYIVDKSGRGGGAFERYGRRDNCRRSKFSGYDSGNGGGAVPRERVENRQRR